MHQQSGWTTTPSWLIGAPTSAIPTIFTPDALPGATLPIYPCIGQAPGMLACITSGLFVYPMAFQFKQLKCTMCMHVCMFVCMQLLVKDLEEMFNRQSLEIHALLVWRHYVTLLGTVRHLLSLVAAYLQCHCHCSLYILIFAMSTNWWWNNITGNNNSSELVWLATTAIQPGHQ